MQIVAGGSAGFVEVCIMHPLDVVKTRLQIQSKPIPGVPYHGTYYKGVFDCFGKMYKQEGLFSYWKGILPPVLVETPKRYVSMLSKYSFLKLGILKNYRACKFFVFEQSKRFFLFGESKPTPLVSILDFH